jgi:hypothetical protein
MGVRRMMGGMTAEIGGVGEERGTSSRDGRVGR